MMRHNNIRDFEANLLRKVSVDVETEPQLQPLDGENIIGLTGDDSKPDIRVTNTNSDSHVHLSPEIVLHKHEQEKKA